MGLILDSSVVIAAERRGENVPQLLQHIFAATRDQEVALFSVGLTELVHGIYRAETREAPARRDPAVGRVVAARVRAVTVPGPPVRESR